MSLGTNDVRMCPNCGCAIWPNQLHVCSRPGEAPWSVIPASWGCVDPAAGTMVKWQYVGSAEPGESWTALSYVLVVAFLVGLLVGLPFRRQSTI